MLSSAHSRMAAWATEFHSPIYGLFKHARVVEVDNRPAHEFKCHRRTCTAKVRCYLDTKDAGSTGNLRKHAKACWGEAVVKAVDTAINATEVHTKLVPNVLKCHSPHLVLLLPTLLSLL
jgi:hypothetical protein